MAAATGNEVSHVLNLPSVGGGLRRKARRRRSGRTNPTQSGLSAFPFPGWETKS